MTEPVAYLNKYLDKSTNITRYKPENQRLLSSDPLYTAEKLLPRVKMTREQKQLMMSYKNNKESFFILLSRTRQLINNPFEFISEEELMSAWLNPEETIEIVPDMKWFVRSKERNLDKNYYYFVGKRPEDYWQCYGYKRAAKKFDTKEEAEKWLNPLTEAVQLPVEGE